ncbi:MAG: aldehyde dehydrogenase family protein [Actinomycetota bacterium]|nr:aldehyde dehydrogenase family protein [Actinomycetota bacterium]
MTGVEAAVRTINPHRPSEVVFETRSSGPDGVERAVARARDAFPEWARRPAAERSAALHEIASELEARAQEIVRLTVKEVGKPVTEARSEVGRAIAIWRFYAQMALAPDGETFPAPDARAWLIARRYPLGVCALIVPWNFPVAIQSWKVAPAVAYGNTVVVKPAPESSGVAALLYEIAARHLPERVVVIVYGDAETGEPLVEHPDVAGVSFTGSVKVGHVVAGKAAGRGAKVQCEMGGQNPAIVLADADLDAAARTIVYSAMAYAGQKCTATSRVVVESDVYDEFRDRLVAAVEAMEVVDPEMDSCEVGPLIREESRADALDAISRGGGTTLTGGKSLDVDGFYLAPTLVELEDTTSVLAKEEVFAPVTAVLKASSTDEALKIANDVPYGLVAGLYTSDLERAMTLVGRIEAGLVRTNAPTTGAEYYAPFGGSKASSIGPREQGPAARDFYTESRTFLIAPPAS